MVAREFVADSSGEAELPTPCRAVLLVSVPLLDFTFELKPQGQLTTALELVSGHVYPVKAEGKTRLSGLTPGGRYRIAVAQTEWEAQVLR